MQPISEIPSQFLHPFAKLCSSDIRVQVEEMRPANLKDSARFLVEDVLSGFPDLIPTESLEVNAHCVAHFDAAMVCHLTSALQEQIKRCGTAELVGYQLQWSVASEKLLVVLDESQSQSTAGQDLVDFASLQPMLLFFLNEILHANARISLMKRTLVDLDVILQGRTSGDSGSGMTTIMNALAIGKVPEQWEAGCKVPASTWISDFIAHVRALHMWAPEAVFSSIPVFWLPHLRNSQALFAALQLVAATKENVNIDHIQIEWEVSKKPYAAGQSTPFRCASVGSSASYSISFGGVSLIGAQWSPFTQVLEDCDPESVNQLPVISARAGFRAPPADAPLHQPTDSGFSIGDYECPVYTDRTRSRLLFSMKLKSLVHTAKWAMIGVHAVLSSEVPQFPS